MICELVSACIIISACLAIYLDDTIYSLLSLMATFILMATLYALNGALYAAIFQLTVGAGTLVPFFLLGEELSKRDRVKGNLKKALIILAISIFLSAAPFIYPAENNTQFFLCDTPFALDLWGLRMFDIILQGIVVLTVALGVSIILYEERRRGKK